MTDADFRREAAEGVWRFLPYEFKHTRKMRRAHYIEDGFSKPICGTPYHPTGKEVDGVLVENSTVEQPDGKLDEFGQHPWSTPCAFCWSIVVDGIDKKAKLGSDYFRRSLI